MPHKPEPTQQPLRLARSVQWIALRKLRTGHKDAKSLLICLDSHIGDGRNGFAWTATVDQLAWECEMSASTARKWLRHLDAEGFIHWQGKQGQTPVFRIVWARIFDAVESAAGEFQSAAGAFQSAAGAFQSAAGALSIMKRRSLDAHKTPPPPDAGEVVVAGIAERLKAAGIRAVPQAIRLALELRDAETLAAIVDHFQRQFVLPDGTQGINAEFLYWRITNPDSAALAPHEGWKEPSPAFLSRMAARSKPDALAATSRPLSEVLDEMKSRREHLERKHAARLDALDRAELLRLADRAQDREAEILKSAILQGKGHACRMQFLELMERDEKPP